MSRRPSRILRLALALALAVALALPQAAAAWWNGVPSGDFFGTHDWILQKAYELLPPESVEWIDLSAALATTDDPDTMLFDFYHHVYDVWGDPYGDAPERIEECWAEIVAARDAGDTAAASEWIGLLSHYYSDICNPMHTDQSPLEDAVHSLYEGAVQTRTDEADENDGWIVPDELVVVDDVAQASIDAATASHDDYAALVDGYVSDGYSADVDAITQRSLSRAVNGLADLLYTLGSSDQGAGGWQGITRIAGADRYETAVLASRSAFVSARTVVIATGADWPDALCAAPLAAAYDAPLLLVRPDSVPACVAEEIARLGATDAIVLGGEGAVSSATEADLGLTVRRVGGPDRYATSALIADDIATAPKPWSHQAFVVNGADFADALGASAVAADRVTPILLTATSDLTAVTAARVDSLDVTEAFIAGGTAVVGPEVESELKARLGEGSVERLAGSDRYGTTAAIVEYAIANWDMDDATVGISSGESFPDALAAGVVLGTTGAPQLLTKAATLPVATTAFLEPRLGDVNAVTVFGGTGAVRPAVENDIRALLDPDYVPPATEPIRAASMTSWVSDASPPQFANVTVFAKVIDQYGQPIPGVTVTSTWHYKSTTPTESEATGPDGVAEMTRNILAATVGYTVVVDSVATYGGATVSASTSFTPQ